MYSRCTTRLTFCIAVLALPASGPTAASLAQQVAEEVDADIAAGTDLRFHGRGAAAPAFVRSATVAGNYTELPAQSSSGPEFGHAVAIDADWLAVGAPGTLVDHGAGFGGIKPAGAIFLFRKQDGEWIPSQRLTPATFGLAPRCGQAVALRGRHLLVGCPGTGSLPQPGNLQGGYAAWHLDQDTDNWEPLAIPAQTTAGSQCGHAVALTGPNSDGMTRAAVGCPGWNSHQGRVLVHAFSDLGGSWGAASARTAGNGNSNDRFGASVWIDQNSRGNGYVRMAVGAPDKLDDLFPQTGRVYLFEGSALVEAASLVGLTSQDRFGTSVALAGNTLVAGALGSITSQCSSGSCGRVARYVRQSNGQWVFQDGGVAVNVGGTPPGVQPEMQFGSAVGIGFDNWIAVAAPRANGSGLSLPPAPVANVGMVELRRAGDGSASVDGNAWQAELRPGVVTGLQLGGGRFGTALDFSSSHLAIGYPLSGTLIGGRRGAVWIYEDDRIFGDGFEP